MAAKTEKEIELQYLEKEDLAETGMGLYRDHGGGRNICSGSYHVS